MLFLFLYKNQTDTSVKKFSVVLIPFTINVLKKQKDQILELKSKNNTEAI